MCRLEAAPDKQISLTDPAARSMMTRSTGLVDYNVQASVDTKHHLIVTHEVTNDGVDRNQLSALAKQARDAMGVESLSAIADRGYFKSEEILACHETGITAFVTQGQDLGRRRSGSLWSRCFHLRRGPQRVPMPSRRTPDLAFCDG